MVDCSRTDIRDALPDLVHDQLEPLARARIEQHLAECAECAAELKLLRSLRSSAFSIPEVDAARVAAAVHAAARGAHESDVTSISASGERRQAAIPIARAARRPAWNDWRAAAGIAAVAVGIAGYAIARESIRASPPAMDSATVAAAPASAPLAASSKARTMAEASAGASTPAAGTFVLGDAVSDLSESDMQTLLQSVDDLEAMPDVDPHPLPLLARVVEGAL